ncbi:ABC transporter substrate-binding protein [Pseudomonas citronellolis]|uniref:ABC transporter substrate-binding protein n=1 Tax=Pseudomonas citronellolis TaxID=53408 RepID=UPI0021C03A38|nr:ABC transporter substrate-binding protein [Pseudomonas citronellolis]UXJ54711.1 ABC transporter substrate-binding protein [Pseudomonas citronellolis]
MRVVVLLLGLWLAGAATAAEDYRNCGRDWRLERPPQRILALNQHAADLLLALGAGPRLVAVSYLDDLGTDGEPGRYRGVPVLSPRYPASEALYALRPDLVVAGFASAFEQGHLGRAELAGRGVASYLLEAACQPRPASDFAGVRQDLLSLGRLLGDEARARRLVERQRVDLHAAAQLAAGREPPRVFYFDSLNGGLESRGGRGFLSELLRAAGARNLFEGVDQAGFIANAEQLVDGDPQVILLADASWSPAADKVRYLRRDPVLSRLRAVREERFVVLPFTWLFPGVHSGEAALELAEALREINEDKASFGKHRPP